MKKKNKSTVQFEDGININQSCWDINGNKIKCDKQNITL